MMKVFSKNVESRSRPRWDALLSRYLACVYIVFFVTFFWVDDATQHYRVYYLLGVVPGLIYLFSRDEWRYVYVARSWLAFAVFVAIITLSGLVTPDITSEDRYDVVRHAVLALTFVISLVAVARRVPWFSEALLVAILLSASAYAVSLLYELVQAHGFAIWSQRLRLEAGYFDNPNRIASVYYAVAILGLVLGGRSKQSRWLAALGFCALLLGSLLVLLTQSRGGLLALAAGITVVLALERRWYLLGALLGVGGAAVAVVESGVLSMRAFSERSSSVVVRYEIWLVALERIQQAPLLGEGWASSHAIYVEQRDRSWIHPHNTYLTVALKTGVLGLIAFLGCLYVWLREGVRQVRYCWVARAGVAVLFAWLVNGLVETRISMAGVHREWLYFFLPLALIVIAELHARMTSRQNGVVSSDKGAE